MKCSLNKPAQLELQRHYFTDDVMSVLMAREKGGFFCVVDIAARVGASAETVSRTIKALAHVGVIHLDGQTTDIADDGTFRFRPRRRAGQPSKIFFQICWDRIMAGKEAGR